MLPYMSKAFEKFVHQHQAPCKRTADCCRSNHNLKPATIKKATRPWFFTNYNVTQTSTVRDQIMFYTFGVCGDT